QHRWLYCHKSLHRLFANAGLKIVEAKHFGLAPAVALHQSYAVVARIIHSLSRRSDCERRRAPATASVNRGVQQRTAAAIYERLEQFFRYRIGAFAPRLGPATWWIAARRAGEFSA